MLKRKVYFSSLGDFMDAMKDELIYGNREGESRENVWYPAVDVYEIATGAIIVVELSGVKKDNLEMYLEGDYLLVKGKRYEPVYNFIKCHHREVLYGDFTRRVKVPKGVDGEKVKAELVEGLLLVFLPLKEKGTVKIDID